MNMVITNKSKPSKDGPFWKLSEFEIGKPLGEGRFGHVYLARTKKEKYIIALKVIHKRQIVEENMRLQLNREVEIQARLSHPNILKMHTFFWDEDKFYLVLHYAAKGELFKHLRKAVKFSEEISATYMYQMIRAIEYCHKNGVIHRDIKPENIMVGYHGEILLADFGWSVHARSQKRKTLCGTKDYLPPEMLIRSPYNEFVDHWCLGILCFEFLAGRTPFETENEDITFQNIKMVSFKFPEYFSILAKNFIGGFLKFNPESRTKLSLAKDDPWIQKNKGYIPVTYKD